MNTKEFIPYIPDDKLDDDNLHLRNLRRDSTYKTAEDVIDDANFGDNVDSMENGDDGLRHEMPEVVDDANYVNPDDLQLNIVISDGAASIAGVLNQAEPVIIDDTRNIRKPTIIDYRRNREEPGIILTKKNLVGKVKPREVDQGVDVYKMKKSTFAKNHKRKGQYRPWQVNPSQGN